MSAVPPCLCGHPWVDHLADLDTACSRRVCGCRWYRVEVDGQGELFGEACAHRNGVAPPDTGRCFDCGRAVDE